MTKHNDPHRTDNNESCPRFVAFAAGDSYVESDDNLESLIAAVKKGREDICIWDYETNRIAAVVRSDGGVQRLTPTNIDRLRNGHITRRTKQ